MESQGFPKDQWWKAFSRPLSHSNYCINSKLSPRRPEQLMCTAKTSQMSPKHGLFKTILSLELLYINWKLCLLGEWLKALSLRKPQHWMCWAKVPKDYWWMSFSRPSSHSHYHMNSKLYPRRHEQLTCRAHASQVSLMKGLFKTILPQHYCTDSRLLSPCLSCKWPFQHHLDTKTITLTPNFVSKENGSKLFLPGDLNNECAQLKLHQC